MKVATPLLVSVVGILLLATGTVQQELWAISPAPGSSIGMEESVPVVAGVAMHLMPSPEEQLLPRMVCATVAGSLLWCTADNLSGGENHSFTPAHLGVQPGAAVEVRLDIILATDGEIAVTLVADDDPGAGLQLSPTTISMTYTVHCEPPFRRWNRLPLFSIPVFDAKRSKQRFIDYYDDGQAATNSLYNRDVARRSCALWGDISVAGDQPTKPEASSALVIESKRAAQGAPQLPYSFFRVNADLSISLVEEACTTRLEAFISARAAEWRMRANTIDHWKWTNPGVTVAAEPIPRIFHFIWLGPSPLPPMYKMFIRGWEQQHPGWEVWWWREGESRLESFLPIMKNAGLFSRIADLRARSDLLRYEVLFAFGGVYLDTDMECVRSLETLLRPDISLLLGREDNFQINNAVLGARRGHPALGLLLGNLSPRIEYLSLHEDIHDVWELTGPSLLTRVIDFYLRGGGGDYSSVIVAPPVVFSPLHFSMTSLPAAQTALRNAVTYNGTYAIHHWGSKSSVRQQSKAGDPRIEITKLTIRPLYISLQILESVSLRLCPANQRYWRICLVFEQKQHAASADAMQTNFSCPVGMACAHRLMCQEHNDVSSTKPPSGCHSVHWRPSGSPGTAAAPDSGLLIPRASIETAGHGRHEAGLRVELLDKAGVRMCAPAFTPV